MVLDITLSNFVFTATLQKVKQFEQLVTDLQFRQIYENVILQ